MKKTGDEFLDKLIQIVDSFLEEIISLIEEKQKQKPVDFSNVDEFTEAMVLVIESAVNEEQNHVLSRLLATEAAGGPAGNVTTPKDS